MLVIPESLDARAERHERLVDLPGFFESISGGFGPVLSLASGQIHERKLRNSHLRFVEENLFASGVEGSLGDEMERRRR